MPCAHNGEVPFQVAPAVIRYCQKSPERIAWLDRLPSTVDHLRTRWHLTLHDPFLSAHVTCAWVAPATTETGEPAVLKIAMPHMEADHEIDGLRFWNGDPMVRLLAADASLGAMLLERCDPGATLHSVPEPEQDVVIARLLRRLWRVPPTPHPFRPLSHLLDHWSAETRADEPQWPDPALVREGLALFHELPRNARNNVLLATDLHAGNVLRAQREPWLAIDPKPFFGDRVYDATQHLINCEARLLNDARGTIRRFADLVAIDADRLTLWVFARAAADPRTDWRNHRWLTIARSISP